MDNIIVMNDTEQHWKKYLRGFPAHKWRHMERSLRLIGVLPTESLAGPGLYFLHGFLFTVFRITLQLEDLFTNVLPITFLFLYFLEIYFRLSVRSTGYVKFTLLSSTRILYLIGNS